MLRRGERAVVGGAIVAVVLAALAAVLTAPSGDIGDRRLSTYLAGPYGAKALAQTLERLGVKVEQRRRPYFDVAEDPAPPPQRLLAFLDIAEPTLQERIAVRDYVDHGGRIFVAGLTGIEACFGYRSRRLRRGAAGDSSAVFVPGASWRLPATLRVLRRLPPESLSAAPPEAEEDRCPPRLADRADTLLGTRDRRPVALRLHFASGGEAILLADAAYVRNRALKETDAGLVMLPWLLGRTRWVTADEYHLGFGQGGSLLGASWGWLVSHPLGCALLQLAAVALVALAVAAVRFGPPRSVIERRRRSPLEHLEALAAGLEGAAGVDTAIALTVSGLRRRLGRAGLMRPDEQRSWLAALELALPTTAGRDAVHRLLRIINQPGGPERALAAAQAVEDVWQELRPQRTRAAS